MERYCPKCNSYLNITNYNKDKNRRDGLQLWCRNCQKNYYKWYQTTERGKQVNILSTEKWVKNNVKKRQLYQKEYMIKNRKILNEKQKIWRNTPKGKLSYTTSNSKRQRNLNWIPLFENPFPEEVIVEYHHINNFFVVPIPSGYHRKTLGKDHKLKCNELIFDLYGLDINKLFQM
jgi:hypothetical protein